MCVTAHFIREDSPKLIKATVSCKPFQGSCTVESIAAHVVGVMDEYGITESAVALTTDTASNVKQDERRVLPFQEWHGCVCYKLQLCALKILNDPRVQKTMAKHNKLTTHLRQSAESTEKLINIQEVCGSVLEVEKFLPIRKGDFPDLQRSTSVLFFSDSRVYVEIEGRGLRSRSSKYCSLAQKTPYHGKSRCIHVCCTSSLVYTYAHTHAANGGTAGDRQLNNGSETQTNTVPPHCHTALTAWGEVSGVYAGL